MRRELTVEQGLYLALVLVAGGMRLYGLGRSPLSEEEARLAYQAWRLYQGATGPVWPSYPLLLNGNLLSFLLLGASDFTARLSSALAGTLLVATPYLLRRELGRWGGLVTSALLTTSPSMLFFSRYVGGEMLVACLALLFLAGIGGYIREGAPKYLYLAAGTLGLLLTAGPSAYAFLAVAATFPLLLWLLRPGGAGKGWEGLLPLWEKVKGKEELAWRCAVLVVGVFVLASTGLLFHPGGLQWSIELLPLWLARFRSGPEAGQPLIYYPQLLALYEPLALIFGLVGGAYLLRKGPNLLASFAAYWFGLAFLLALAAPKRPAEAVVLIALPLLTLAGMVVGRVLEKLEARASWREEGYWGLLIALGFAYLFLWLAGYACGRPPAYWAIAGRNLPVHVWAYMLVGLAFLGLVGYMAWRALGRERGPTLGVALLFLALAGFGVHTSWNLNYHHPADPVEPMVERPTSGDVVRMVGMLEDLSHQKRMDRHLLGFEVQEELAGLLAWYLRDFRQVRFTASPRLSKDAQAVILQAGKQPDLAGSYVSQRFRLQGGWQPQNLSGPSFWAWYLFREAREGKRSWEGILYLAQ